MTILAIFLQKKIQIKLKTEKNLSVIGLIDSVTIIIHVI